MNVFANYQPTQVQWQLIKDASDLINLQLVEDDGETGIDLTGYTFVLEITTGTNRRVIKTYETGNATNPITGDDEGNVVIGKKENLVKLVRSNQYFATLYATVSGEKIPLAYGNLLVK